ncbi:MAG: hypothetical protein H5U40_09520 [Polyangiaceae bacterium]|nr:hypothetical protein [Polyangiaceae bacterium]
MVREGNAEFERCHAAELSDGVGVDERHECWESWIRQHAEGQPTHRVLYARERMVALAHGESRLAIPAESELSYVRNAEPSAPVVPEGEAPADPPRMRPPRYGGDPTCDPACNSPWNRCISRCVEGRMPCIEACESEYRACMRGCF